MSNEEEEESHDVFNREDHQVAFIFDPDDGEDARGERPTKRRRMAKQTSIEEPDEASSPSLFFPLLNGAEKPECVRRRQQLFEESWAMIDTRIQGILRDSNSATLDQVSAFVSEAEPECGDRIPSAFIITGPNMASQDLLFEQLSETLQRSSPSKFVRLRSSEAMNLKAALKKIIRDATSKTSDDDGDDDLQVGQGQDGRRYLDYDLEALQAFTQHQSCDHIFVAFQDSEGFDSSLLSDLIQLFSSWRPRIPFTLLFGIATSVELLQARLLKSACRLIYGQQFDCVQTETILENVFKGAVASSDVPLRLGPQVLRGMLDRQHDQVAGIQAFISSLKYAYMCHFFGNPLSILVPASEAAGNDILQAEHVEAIRHLPSLRYNIESLIGYATADCLEEAKLFIENDTHLLARVRFAVRHRGEWIDERLRALFVVEAAGATQSTFPRAYVDSMTRTLPESGDAGVVDCIRRMEAGALAGMLRRVILVFKEGEASVHLGPATREDDCAMQAALEEKLALLEQLMAEAGRAGITLRTKYSGQNKVMRTTVIAQRVQLSRDSAALREEDKRLTDIVDTVTGLVTSHFKAFPVINVLFSESWFYDSKSPMRDVMVPLPRATFERGLGRPHDYLSCDCCKMSTDDDGLLASLPATSILYRLHLEAGNLINVADLWSAFYALVTEKETEDEEEEEEKKKKEKEKKEKSNERRALVMFYRGLAELRALGFVKGSKKKTDHIAKVRWL